MRSPEEGAPDLAAAFAAERPRLLGIAYRMTGSHHDAEDVLQEAWLRFARHADTLARPAAWLTTVVTRLAIDRLRQVEARRAEYVGPWLPEPTALERGPEELALAADSLTLAFLIVLDSLSPLERAAFILADVFGEPYSVIAATLQRSEPACRQLVHRARSSVRAARHHEERPLDAGLLHRLMTSLIADDPEELLELLSPEIVLVSDGGPERRAARRPVVGVQRVARFLTTLSRRAPGATVGEGVVNHSACLFITTPAGPLIVTGSAVGDQIVSLVIISNPDKVSGSEVPRQMV